MIAVRVTVPIASFRKGLAREYLETEMIPPPATCYGFLLSLVGETDRRRHIGVRIAPALLSRPSKSTVLRTVWRVKSLPLGTAGNTRPDFQQLLTNVELVIWVDAGEDRSDPNLEQRVRNALERPQSLARFGGLSLGESTHLVDEVNLLAPDEGRDTEVFLLDPSGRLSLPVWVDHVGASGTLHATGNVTTAPLVCPEKAAMAMIGPPPQ